MPNGSNRLRTGSARLHALIATTALLAATLPGSAAQDNHAWKTYTNERFGVFGPLSLRSHSGRGTAPDNNDGLTL